MLVLLQHSFQLSHHVFFMLVIFWDLLYKSNTLRQTEKEMMTYFTGVKFVSCSFLTSFKTKTKAVQRKWNTEAEAFKKNAAGEREQQGKEISEGGKLEKGGYTQQTAEREKEMSQNKLDEWSEVLGRHKLWKQWRRERGVRQKEGEVRQRMKVTKARGMKRKDITFWFGNRQSKL